jgi:hypothetical protein
VQNGLKDAKIGTISTSHPGTGAMELDPTLYHE